MSNYPFSLDNNITLPGVSGSTQEDVAITALRSAVFAIETELGVTPSGVYPDVRTRLDILEARIQFGISPQIPNDGYVKSPLFIWNVPANVILSVSDGYGAPTENRLRGSLYMRSDGSLNNQLYVNVSPAGSPGANWSPVQTEQFHANNDLAGFPVGTDGHLAQTVIGLFNHPLNPNMNTMSLTQDGYHLTWDNFDGYWEPQTGFIPGHDLAAFSGPYGRTGQTVTGIQGFHVSPAAPQDGYMFVWSAADSAWEPRVRPIVFTNSVVVGDGYVARTNIMSNKGLTQSPNISAAGKVGMINFGSRSTGATTGVTDNYGTILGGDRLQVSAPYGIAVGGDSNTSSGQYAAVVGGLTNTASGQFAAVLDGTNNTASQTQSVVIDGYSNTASAINSFVLNGGSNTAGGQFSGILNGISNAIASGATHAGIGWGQLNSISATGISSIILGGSGNQIVGQNSLLGTPTNAHVSSNFVSALNGIGHLIGTGSDHATIISGNGHTISSSSGFAFIGAGNNLTATGLYATILNSTGGSVNGLHSLIVNGNTNAVTASYSSILNGHNNTITINGNDAHGTIIDGYSNTVTGQGSLIGDGYNQSISGQFSSILNGNFNTIAGRNSTILNGASNNIDSLSAESTVIIGSNNVFTNSANTTAVGGGNTFTNATATFVIGTSNNIQSTSSFINGTTNTLLAGSLNNRMFGSFNTVGTNAATNFIVGNGNNVGPSTTTTGTFAFGSNNIIDGALGSSVNGSSNISTASVTNIHGQFGKARLFGQEVRANSRFTATTIAVGSNGVPLPTGTINVVSTTGFPNSPGTIAIVTTLGLQTVAYTSTNGTQFLGCTGGVGIMSTGGQVGKIGESQWSRLILTGVSSGLGNAVPLQLQDTVVANPTFVDGYSYDMSIKLLITNISNIGANPVVPARHYIDVLAHQESGILFIDNINFTVSTPNTSDSATRTPWTVSVTSVGNKLVLQVDAEVPSSYVQPGNGPSNRRAIATIDMREISRI